MNAYIKMALFIFTKEKTHNVTCLIKIILLISEGKMNSKVGLTKFCVLFEIKREDGGREIKKK